MPGGLTESPGTRVNFRNTFERVNQGYVRLQDLDPDEYTLVSSPGELKDILQGIGYPGDLHDYGCLLVKLGDGDYNTIWGARSCIPYLSSKVELLWMNGVLVTH